MSAFLLPKCRSFALLRTPAVPFIHVPANQTADPHGSAFSRHLMVPILINTESLAVTQKGDAAVLTAYDAAQGPPSADRELGCVACGETLDMLTLELQVQAGATCLFQVGARGNITAPGSSSIGQPPEIEPEMHRRHRD
jgi:hypothetical protein